MRPRGALISLLTGALSACVATSAPPRLGYAPPSEEPAEPGPAYVGQGPDLIWNQLLDRLIQSSLQVDLADPERGIVVASYSGDPEPYVTCGWILVHRGDDLEQVAASGEASFNRVVQGRRLELTRGMKLDARLVVEVKPDGGGAGVETTSNYVLTKTIVAEDRAGRPHGRAHEVVSFSAGGRGEFNKGTVCQPSGELERIVLGVLPSMARVEPRESSEPASKTQAAASRAPARGTQTGGSGPSAAGQVTIAQSELPATEELEAAGAETPMRADADADVGEELSAEVAGEGDAQLPQVPDPEVPDGSASELAGLSNAAAPEASDAGLPEALDAEAAEVRNAALSESASPESRELSLACPIPDKIFCEVLDVTGPYRRANQEQNLGLAVDAIEGGSPLLGGSDLSFDVSLPSYDAYLTVSFFMEDGTVYHVRSGSDRRWPAHAREFVGDAGLSADGRSVELVVAVASDVPVFASPRPPSEAAELYLSELRQRLLEISNGGSPAQIAASLIVVTPA